MSQFGAKLDKYNTDVPLYVQIMDQIKAAIAGGDFKVGEAIPSEREMAQLFDVSRVPVREALKTLEFIGLIERVPGKGMVVRTFSMNELLASFNFIMVDPEATLLELFEVREALEGLAAKLAAQRRTPEDIRNMERTLIQMEVEIRMGCEVDDTSNSFHTAMALSTHNEVFIKMYNYLQELLAFSRKRTLNDQARHETVLSFHRAIFEFVKAGDVEGAVEAMNRHMKDALAWLLKWLETPHNAKK